MNYWKYKFVSSMDKPDGVTLEEYLNTFGADGWEMVNGQFTGVEFTFFFRRIDYERQMKERMESMARLHKGKMEAHELMKSIEAESKHTDQ